MNMGADMGLEFFLQEGESGPDKDLNFTSFRFRKIWPWKDYNVTTF